MRPDYVSGLRKSLKEMIEKKEDPYEILGTLIDYVDEAAGEATHERKEILKEIRDEIREHDHVDGRVVKPL